MAVVRSLVANGYGYALVNMRPLNRQSPDGNPLALVALDGGFRPLTLGLATMRTDRKPRILRAFEQHCRSAIGDDRIPGMAMH
jgi:DNA-binding transcriptional LysR family regulator